jgi:colicin import membrane protein
VAVILFHVVLAVLLSINLSSNEKPPVPAAKKHNIIDAVAIDAKQYDERQKQKELAARKLAEEQKKAAEEKKRAAEEKRRQQLERKKALEEKRLAEKKKAEAEAKKQKELAIAKKKEEERKAREKAAKEEQARKEKERLAKEKAEKERLAKEKAEKERLAREKAEKERLEAERKRKEEEARRRAEEKAELERAVLEEERRREEARKEAERQARLQTQRQQYIMQIKQQIENNWLRPISTTEGQSCDVIVTQTMTGDVIDVRLQSCSSDVAFQRSVERAVRKASPLPLPPNPDVFERQIYFTFNPR